MGKRVATFEKFSEDKLFEGMQNYHEDFPGKIIKKVRLIFPGGPWEELGLFLMERAGIFSGFFRSVAQAKEFVKSLIAKNVKADELVIGSHGNGKAIIMTRKDKGAQFNEEILDDVKSIIHPKTVIFFTACYGADFLPHLKSAAEKIGGAGVYGSSGVYNFVTNKSQKGFYYCSAKAFDSKGQTVDNKFLLDRGLCRRVKESPVSWIEPVEGFDKTDLLKAMSVGGLGLLFRKTSPSGTPISLGDTFKDIGKDISAKAAEFSKGVYKKASDIKDKFSKNARNAADRFKNAATSYLKRFNPF